MHSKLGSVVWDFGNPRLFKTSWGVVRVSAI